MWLCLATYKLGPPLESMLIPDKPNWLLPNALFLKSIPALLKTTVEGLCSENIAKEIHAKHVNGWNTRFSSTCSHRKFVCPECGRELCMLHWPYPMRTENEAVHFLKAAELRTGKKCFVRQVNIGKFKKWKIFTSETDYRIYIETRKHKRWTISLPAKRVFVLPFVVWLIASLFPSTS